MAKRKTKALAKQAEAHHDHDPAAFLTPEQRHEKHINLVKELARMTLGLADHEPLPAHFAENLDRVDRKERERLKSDDGTRSPRLTPELTPAQRQELEDCILERLARVCTPRAS